MRGASARPRAWAALAAAARVGLTTRDRAACGAGVRPKLSSSSSFFFYFGVCSRETTCPLKVGCPFAGGAMATVAELCSRAADVWRRLELQQQRCTATLSIYTGFDQLNEEREPPVSSRGAHPLQPAHPPVPAAAPRHAAVARRESAAALLHHTGAVAIHLAQLAVDGVPRASRGAHERARRRRAIPARPGAP
eukprot:3785589-Prymnesium_polylepis.1